ncbi:hypothetical protein BFP46_24905 [Bacillus licheniformis]|nr:hypothetical protein BFP46_24905 [Bacillus licheniformis]
MKFIHEKYDTILYTSALLGFILFIINNRTVRSDLLYICIFIVFAVFISAVGIVNHRYKKRKQD